MIRVRFTSFLAHKYRGREFILSREGALWYCTIEDRPHQGRSAIGALKGWFMGLEEQIERLESELKRRAEAGADPHDSTEKHGQRMPRQRAAGNGQIPG